MTSLSAKGAVQGNEFSDWKPRAVTRRFVVLGRDVHSRTNPRSGEDGRRHARRKQERYSRLRQRLREANPKSAAEPGGAEPSVTSRMRRQLPGPPCRQRLRSLRPPIARGLRPAPLAKERGTPGRRSARCSPGENESVRAGRKAGTAEFLSPEAASTTTTAPTPRRQSPGHSSIPVPSSISRGGALALCACRDGFRRYQLGASPATGREG